MGAVYHPTSFRALVSQHLDDVTEWIQQNPGKTVDSCASALGMSYEVVFSIWRDTRMVLLPNSSGEAHWHAHMS